MYITFITSTNRLDVQRCVQEKKTSGYKWIVMIALIDSHEREQQTKLEIVNWALVTWERKNLTL